MAIVKSKVLGLYVLDESYGQTAAFPVLQSTNAAGSALAAEMYTAGYVLDDKLIVKNSQSKFIGLFKLTGTEASPSVQDLTGNLKLQLAATNTGMDISNTVNEVVANNGAGGSSTYIVSGAQSWSFSADGFLTNEAGDQVNDVFRASEASKYVIAKFDLDVTNSSSKGFVGQGLVESFSVSGGFDDNVTYSISISGYGQIMNLG